MVIKWCILMPGYSILIFVMMQHNFFGAVSEGILSLIVSYVRIIMLTICYFMLNIKEFAKLCVWFFIFMKKLSFVKYNIDYVWWHFNDTSHHSHSCLIKMHCWLVTYKLAWVTSIEHLLLFMYICAYCITLSMSEHFMKQDAHSSAKSIN